MKTVSVKVLSSKPISLKKATSILSTFASADNGASPAICAYLRRALVSFKELRHQEKELGPRRLERKHERLKSEIVSEVEAVPENPTQSVEVSQAPSHKQKRHRLDSNISGNSLAKDDKPTRSVVSDPETRHGVGDSVGEMGKKEKRGKNKQKDIIKAIKEEIKEVGLVDSESAEPQSNNKKKKKMKTDGSNFDNNGMIEAENKYDRGKIGIEEGKKGESKERKSEVEEKEVVDASEEQWSKKKRRRKTD